METKEILEKVRSGEMSVEEAEGFFRRKPFEDLGYAKLDSHRRIRSGAAEVVFCQGKDDSHLTGIFERIMEKGRRNSPASPPCSPSRTVSCSWTSRA